MKQKLAPFFIKEEGSTLSSEQEKEIRETGPIVSSDGLTKEWKINDRFHRENGPAVIKPFNGTYYNTIVAPAKNLIKSRDDMLMVMEWWQNNMRHRLDGPAYVSPAAEQWWLYGCTHRIDGPAETFFGIEKNILKETWYANGKKHRWDGPAVVDHENNKEEWWVDGKRMENLPEILENCQIEGPFTEWSEGEWTILRLALTEDLVHREETR
jgi:hypothetical protein